MIRLIGGKDQDDIQRAVTSPITETEVSGTLYLQKVVPVTVNSRRVKNGVCDKCPPGTFRG